jgi:hypothetical protein
MRSSKRETRLFVHARGSQKLSCARRLPCRWAEQTIVIFEDRFEVRLAAPYTVDDVTGNDAPSVARVKKVVSAWWMRERRRVSVLLTQLSGELAKLS